MNRRTLFIIGVVGLLLFEAANVYFIMPMPGSQRWRTVGLAYVIYRWRWVPRIGLWAALLIGLPAAWRARGYGKWLAPAAAAAVVIATYLFNFQMAADQMFRPVATLSMQSASGNTVPPERLVVGIAVGDEARAYPIRFIGYHHQVRDVVGGRPIMVTYCTVCRTGRIYSPDVDGRPESFRLVGMDHFNAMFEDAATGSWWRQATGEAIAGARKGKRLEELPSMQMTLAEWIVRYPRTLVMQEDPAFVDDYGDPEKYAYEDGTSRKALTGTNPDSWQDKSWVVGISLNGKSKAYDWNRLRTERIVNDVVGGVPIVLMIAADNATFAAFQRPSTATTYTPDALAEIKQLRPIQASQEFWHSWRTFYPETERY